jgi:uncharacterized protein
MKIAVSGASGLVGTALVRSLNSAGHETLRLVRGGEQSQKASQQDCRPDILWDPSCGLRDPRQMESVDALVHLAGRSIASARWTTAEKQKIRDSRVSATEVLVRQLANLHSPPPVLITASAIGIYGDASDRSVDEDSPPGSDFLAQVARDWESAAEPLREKSRVAHARLGIVLSAHGGALAKVVPLFRWMLGGRLGSGRQYWSWVALDDCVRAICWMLENESARGAFNIVAPQPVTNAEFTSQLARQLNRPVGPPVPKLALRLALGEMADALLLCSCRATPTRLLRGGFHFDYPNLPGCLEAELERLPTTKH